ncbi:MAG: hypothetical protein ABUL67_00365 [Haliangium ochraceum]
MTIDLTFPGRSLVLAELLAGLTLLGGVASYVLHRPVARNVVWPD